MIAIEINARGAISMLDRLGESIPRVSGEAIYKIAKRGAINLKLSARQNITHPGSILPTIQAEKISKNTSVVVMSKKGLFRDIARPHYVSLQRTLISFWAKRYFLSMRKTGKSRVNYARTKGFIYVTPTPFVRQAYLKTLKEAKPIIEREISRTIQTKGR